MDFRNKLESLSRSLSRYGRKLYKLTNALDYLAENNYNEKCFVACVPVSNIIKLFMTIIYKIS